MRRRSFIAKLLAGLAVMPLLKRLLQDSPPEKQWPIYVAWGSVDQVTHVYVNGREVLPEDGFYHLVVVNRNVPESSIST